MDVAVAAVASPTGPRLAGRYGVGLLSVGATLTEAGFDALAHHWNVMEERAATFGTAVDRAKWRLVGLMHIAETREQAYRTSSTASSSGSATSRGRGLPADGGRGRRRREMIDFVNTSGIGAVGTIDDAVGAGRRSSSTSPRASARCSCSPTSGPTRWRPTAPTSSSPST